METYLLKQPLVRIVNYFALKTQFHVLLKGVIS